MISLKKTLKALATKPFRTLWTGTWNSGTIIVPDTEKYKMFYITMSGQGTVIPVFHYNTLIRGIGGYDNGTNAITFHFGATVSGNAWTFNGCHYIAHYANGNHSVLTACTVTSIVGII